MPTIGEQLAKENQDLIKDVLQKTISVIFKFSKDQFSKVDLSQSMEKYLKNSDEFKIGESSIKDNLDKIEKLKDGDVEILSAEEVAELTNICNKNNVSYETIIINENECALVFESNNTENLQFTFAEYNENCRESLDLKLEKATNLLPDKDMKISLAKEQER